MSNTQDLPSPIHPNQINATPLSGLDLPISRATHGRISNMKELFERLFKAESAVIENAQNNTGSDMQPAAENTSSPQPETPPAEPEQAEINKDIAETEALFLEEEPPKEPASSTTPTPRHPPHDGIIVIPPQQTPAPVMKKARELFPEISNDQWGFWGDMPLATWPNGEKIFPKVPRKDPNYRLNTGPSPAEIILAIMTNTNIMITGPSGSGKTSSVEQIAARTGRPFFRINFDGEIRRTELLGHHMQRVTENGSFIEWQPGAIQTAIGWPSLIVLDEYDRGDPDLIYAIHGLLEGEDLHILEEGDMTVKRHPDCRITATANTKGAAESNGLYAESTQQSEASRNRFGYWSEHKYMTANEETDLISRMFPTIKKDKAKLIADIAADLRNNFLKHDLTTTCSTRQTKIIARDLSLALSFNPGLSEQEAKNIIYHSFNRVMVQRATTPEQMKKITTILHNKGLSARR